jgi:hypothetical protein
MSAINQDFTMFAGDTVSLDFTVDMDGTLAGAIITWVLVRWGAVVLTKTTGSGIRITGAKTFSVDLLPEDTEDLEGDHCHEAEVTDSFGAVSTVAVGMVRIDQTYIK